MLSHSAIGEGEQQASGSLTSGLCHDGHQLCYSCRNIDFTRPRAILFLAANQSAAPEQDQPGLGMDDKLGGDLKVSKYRDQIQSSPFLITARRLENHDRASFQPPTGKTIPKLVVCDASACYGGQGCTYYLWGRGQHHGQRERTRHRLKSLIILAWMMIL